LLFLFFILPHRCPSHFDSSFSSPSSFLLSFSPFSLSPLHVVILIIFPRQFFNRAFSLICERNHGFFTSGERKVSRLGKGNLADFIQKEPIRMQHLGRREEPTMERTNQNAAFGEKGGANNGKDQSECSIWGEKFLGWAKEIWRISFVLFVSGADLVCPSISLLVA